MTTKAEYLKKADHYEAEAAKLNGTIANLISAFGGSDPIVQQVEREREANLEEAKFYRFIAKVHPKSRLRFLKARAEEKR